MRWKISHRGHDPRQLDLIAIFALLIPDRRRLQIFRRRLGPAKHHSLRRPEPKRSLVRYVFEAFSSDESTSLENAVARKTAETSGRPDWGRWTRRSSTRWFGRRGFGR